MSLDLASDDGHDCDHSHDRVRDHAENDDRAPSGPTRTKTIQDDYQAEVYRRFRRVRGLIRKTVVENDALGLRDQAETPGSSDPFANVDLSTNAEPGDDFDFEEDGEKIDAFLKWFRSIADDEVLEVVRRGPDGGITARERWQNVYIRRAYGRGLKFANQRLREAGLDVDGLDLDRAFSQPVAAETLSRLYTRNFRALQGITQAVGTEISRKLSEGLAKGWNPRKMASELNDRVDSIGETRARTLARTETIRAHTEATLDRYEGELGEGGSVVGEAEFLTADDARVCPKCRPLDGREFSIVEARGIIPVHPNCRCAWVPLVD